MEEKIKTEKVNIGVIKEYTDKGLLVSADYEYVLFVEEDNKYLDVFDTKKEEKYAVFRRVPYSNSTSDGEPFGTKLLQVNEHNVKSGDECVVLLNMDFRNVFYKDEISLDELREFALKSKFFIRQRKEYILDKIMELDSPFTMLKIVAADSFQKRRIMKKKNKQK